MAWFLIARLLFIAAVGYSAYQLQPLGGEEPIPNLTFGMVLGILVIALEIRLKDIAMTHMLGSMIGAKVAIKEGDGFAANVLFALAAVSAVVLIIEAL